MGQVSAIKFLFRRNNSFVGCYEQQNLTCTPNANNHGLNLILGSSWTIWVLNIQQISIKLYSLPIFLLVRESVTGPCFVNGLYTEEAEPYYQVPEYYFGQMTAYNNNNNNNKIILIYIYMPESFYLEVIPVSSVNFRI